jgi:uncharacterized protein
VSARTAQLDFSECEVVDVHMHGWRNSDAVAVKAEEFEEYISFPLMGLALVSDPAYRHVVVSLRDDPPDRSDPKTAALIDLLSADDVLLLTLRRYLSELLGCEPTRPAVAAARQRALAADPPGYNAALLRDAKISDLFYDEGSPQPTLVREDFWRDLGESVNLHRVWRIETCVTELTREDITSYRHFEERFEQELDRAAADSAVVAYKCLIAIKTGLKIDDPSIEECETAFEAWRANGFYEKDWISKPIRDRLLRRAFVSARRHDRVMHIHTGQGTVDVELDLARPAHLFPLFREFIRQPVVLIHAGFPWAEEAAAMSAAIPFLFLDISAGSPWWTFGFDQKLESILALAPPAKVMNGSDSGFIGPEGPWLAAKLVRRSLARVLQNAIDRDYLTGEEARRIGEGVLRNNALRLHGI